MSHLPQRRRIKTVERDTRAITTDTDLDVKLINAVRQYTTAVAAEAEHCDEFYAELMELMQTRPAGYEERARSLAFALNRSTRTDYTALAHFVLTATGANTLPLKYQTLATSSYQMALDLARLAGNGTLLVLVGAEMARIARRAAGAGSVSAARQALQRVNTDLSNLILDVGHPAELEGRLIEITRELGIEN